MAPQGMAIIQLLFTPLERVSRMAWFGLVLGLAAIIGPILGGLLIEWNLYDLGWRVIFLINLPVGLLAIVMGLLVLPPAEEKASLRIDPLGAAVFACGFAGLLYGLIDGPENGWTALPIATLLGGVALLIFGWHRAGGRRKTGLPSVVDPALFSIATFGWTTAAAFCFNAAMVGFLLVFAVSLQQGLGLSPLDTALVHIPFGLGVMAGVGLIAPRLLPRLGKVLPIAGGVLMLVSVVAVLLAIAGGNSGDVLLLGLLVLAGLGMGVISGPLGPIVVAEVDRARAGTASATFRTAQQIGGALGIALVGAAYFAVDGSDAAARLAGSAAGGLGGGGAACLLLPCAQPPAAADLRDRARRLMGRQSIGSYRRIAFCPPPRMRQERCAGLQAQPREPGEQGWAGFCGYWRWR